MGKKLEKNVSEWLNKISSMVGNLTADAFSQTVFCEIHDNEELNSPIEQILYMALRASCQINDIPHGDPVSVGSQMFFVGFDIFPQKKIGTYRCDFEVVYGGPIVNGKQESSKSLIVECDSQAFHERTEEERRYEKARDRYFVSEGHKVFHFTGKEIVKNPMKVAAEIISYVISVPVERLLIDDNY